MIDPVVAELRRIRETLGLTHAQVAARISRYVSSYRVKGWEEGHLDLDLPELRAWCTALSCDLRAHEVPGDETAAAADD